MAEEKDRKEKIKDRKDKKEMDLVRAEFAKANETNEKLANMVKNQQLEIKKGHAVMTKQGGMLKQYVEEQSPFLKKAFGFMKERKAGREGGKLKNLISPRTLGPAVLKGLSLGLMKFGVPGAIGAAKMIDVVDGYQEFSAEQRNLQQEQAIDVIKEMTEAKKEKGDIVKALKETGMKSRDVALALEAYGDEMDATLKESMQSGIDTGSSNKEIIDTIREQSETTADVSDDTLNMLIDAQRETTAIIATQNDIHKDKLAFDKEAAQDAQLRWLDEMDLKRDQEDEGSGLFSSLLGGLGLGAGAGGLGGFMGALKKATPLVKGLGQAGLVAAAAWAGWEVGKVLNKGINRLTEFFSGGANSTLGGWFYDLTHPTDGSQKMSEDEYFIKGEGRKLKNQAKRAGFKVDAKTTRGEFDEFIKSDKYAKFRQRQLKLDSKKPDRRSEVIRLEKENKRQIQQQKEKDKQDMIQSQSEAIEKVGQNIVVSGGGKSKRIDEINSNADDLLPYIVKGVGN